MPLVWSQGNAVVALNLITLLPGGGGMRRGGVRVAVAPGVWRREGLWIPAFAGMTVAGAGMAVTRGRRRRRERRRHRDGGGAGMSAIPALRLVIPAKAGIHGFGQSGMTHCGKAPRIPDFAKMAG